MSTSTDTDLTVLTGLDSEWVEPCECALHQGLDPAAWIMWPACCGIEKGAFVVPYILACSGCKDRKINSENAILCTLCDTVYAPASLAWRYIEPLNKRHE